MDECMVDGGKRGVEARGMDGASSKGAVNINTGSHPGVCRCHRSALHYKCERGKDWWHRSWWIF
eukprot:scaffold4885_cov154-Isochrysis_galbana.AAC.1